MTAFALAVACTIGVSFLCSLLEAMFLSTTSAEVEALKEKHPHRGKLLEDSREHMEETISSILTLNTIANTSVRMRVAAKDWCPSRSTVLVKQTRFLLISCPNS